MEKKQTLPTSRGAYIEWINWMINITVKEVEIVKQCEKEADSSWAQNIEPSFDVLLLFCLFSLCFWVCFGCVWGRGRTLRCLFYALFLEEREKTHRLDSDGS